MPFPFPIPRVERAMQIESFLGIYVFCLQNIYFSSLLYKKDTTAFGIFLPVLGCRLVTNTFRLMKILLLSPFRWLFFWLKNEGAGRITNDRSSFGCISYLDSQ